MSDKTVSKKLSDIGKAALVMADKKTKEYASAHDFRRAFGTRWAKRVTPAVLQRRMRHSDIKATMEYYVGFDADDIADDLWANHPSGPSVNTVVNTLPPAGDSEEKNTLTGG